MFGPSHCETPSQSLMKSISLAILLALPIVAQDDRVFLINGTKIEGVRVNSFDIRELKYSKGGSNEVVVTDQIAKVDLAKFADVYRRGIKDPGLMLTVAKEQLEAKNTLLAQLGLVGAAAQFFDEDKPQEAVGALEDLQKEIPDAGVIPEVYRQKFEYYMGLGQKGAANALKVAKKYHDDAQGGAWPNGLAVEAEFFMAMAERASGGSPKDFQAKLRDVSVKAHSANVMVANRASVQLANSLREAKDLEGARKIYDDLANKTGVDSSSRAGAFLGLGQLTMDAAAASDKDAYKKALLLFLRVHLETTDAWPSLHAEAMYYAILAADKWRGTDYQYIMARCRGVLFNEFKDSDWAQRAKSGR